MTDQPAFEGLAALGELHADTPLVRDPDFGNPDRDLVTGEPLLSVRRQPVPASAALDRILADADHHTTAATRSAEKHPDTPELAAAHSGMAAGPHIAAAHIARGNPELVALVKQRTGEADQPAAPAEPQPSCCVCGGGPVTYRNFREQSFCTPCSNCRCAENPCVLTGVNDPAVSAIAAERCGDAGPSPDAYEEMRQRAEQAESKLAALKRAHVALAEQGGRDQAALAEARQWARHGYEIGQRSCTWSDHGVAPTWLTGSPERHEETPDA